MARTAAGCRSGMNGYELHDHLSEQLFRPLGGYFENFSSSISRINRFNLRYRYIEDLLAERGISVSVADDGGSPSTGYTAYCFGDTLSFDTSSTSPITVSGLTNGEAYECLVTATNDVGTSPLSGISAPVTPVAPPPGC